MNLLKLSDASYGMPFSSLCQANLRTAIFALVEYPVRSLSATSRAPDMGCYRFLFTLCFIAASTLRILAGSFARVTSDGSTREEIRLLRRITRQDRFAQLTVVASPHSPRGTAGDHAVARPGFGGGSVLPASDLAVVCSFVWFAAASRLPGWAG